MMERARECAGCMDVKISKTRLSELRRKADLAQSLADALEDLLASGTDDKYANYEARAALANYRKGE